MKKYLSESIIHLKSETYLTLIIAFAPLLNFLASINTDIYAPSMPSLASYFNASIVIIKNTISITLLGWTIGAIFFGILIDSIGRKKILMFGISSYIIASIFALWCQNIHQLMILRFIQGLTVSSISVGCRTLVIDNISGARYPVAMLYASLGYGLGPIIGPFVGGIFQYYFGWQANFIALASLGTLLLSILILFIKESIPQKQPLTLHHAIKKCASILNHKKFVLGILILGLIQTQTILYPTLGPFIVENILHYSVLVYGNSALLVGGGYFIGAMINRVLLKYFFPKYVCYVGCFFLLTGLILSYLFAALQSLNLYTLIIPLILLCISAGLICSNIVATNTKQFPENAGLASAIQTSLLLFMASTGIFLISHIHIAGLIHLSIIYSALILLELFIFFFSYRPLFDA